MVGGRGVERLKLAGPVSNFPPNGCCPSALSMNPEPIHYQSKWFIIEYWWANYIFCALRVILLQLLVKNTQETPFVALKMLS